jgi:predicted nucleic acid-binding protein
VVDASALVHVLVSAPGSTARETLIGTGGLAAPELIDIEVASTARKLVAGSQLSADDGLSLIRRAAALPVARHPHRSLLERIWELRGSLSAYDACYVALAEQLGADLITADRPLARSRGARCAIRLVT